MPSQRPSRPARPLSTKAVNQPAKEIAASHGYSVTAGAQLDLRSLERAGGAHHCRAQLVNVRGARYQGKLVQERLDPRQVLGASIVDDCEQPRSRSLDEAFAGRQQLLPQSLAIARASEADLAGIAISEQELAHPPRHLDHRHLLRGVEHQGLSATLQPGSTEQEPN